MFCRLASYKSKNGKKPAMAKATIATGDKKGQQLIGSKNNNQLGTAKIQQ